MTWNAAVVAYGIMSFLRGDGTPPVAHPPQGPIAGTTKPIPESPDVITEFLGIPFAVLPIGDLRFEKPLPHPPWTSVFEATEFSDSCIQDYKKMEKTFPELIYKNYIETLNYSEDCLYLNIYYPGDFASRDRNRKLPVIVWIHGGAFILGQASFALYQGDLLSLTADAIVVTFNYRLSVFGFLTSGDDVTPGNTGLYDQRLALSWVRENIAAFGGDPDKVTLMGESAGAISANLHMLSEGSRGLFQQVVIISGVVSRHSLQEQEEAVSNTAKVYKLFNCTSYYSDVSLECLKSVPADVLFSRLVALDMDILFTPSMDGRFLPDLPEAMVSSGRFAHVPSVWVTVPFESSFYFMAAEGNALDNGISDAFSLRYAALMAEQFPESSTVLAKLISFYDIFTSLENPLVNLDRTARMMSDGAFEAPKDLFMDALSNQGQDVYEIYFTPRYSFLPEYSYAPGAHHSDLIYAVFGNNLPGKVYGDVTTTQEADVTRSLMNVISTFASSGKATYIDKNNQSMKCRRYFQDSQFYTEIVLGLRDMEKQGLWADNKNLWNKMLAKTSKSQRNKRRAEDMGVEPPVIIGSKVIAMI